MKIIYLVGICLSVWGCVAKRQSSAVADLQTENAETPQWILDDEAKYLKEYPLSEPFRKGESGTLEWQVRFNFPECHNAPNRDGAFCLIGDYTPSNQKAGVARQLKEWAFDPTIKSIYATYFSFSNKEVRTILCHAARAMNKKVTVYVHQSNLSETNVQALNTCSSNLKVVPRGTEFGDGYLQHAKIFMALEHEDLKSFADMTDAERVNFANTRLRVTSSSANMSSFGAGGMHLENWLFLEDQEQSYLMQENICFFQALDGMASGSATDQRVNFAEIFKSCRSKIGSSKRDDITFFANPHNKENPEVYADAIKPMLTRARSSVKVAIHRLTTSSITYLLERAKSRNLSVKVLFDDDTYKASKCTGSGGDVGAYDVQTIQKLRDAGIEVGFLETNNDIFHLHHNKFIIVDDEVLFQGAGNFTSTALNISGLGNIEQYYLIKEPGIVKAYVDGFDYLNSISTLPENHPMSNLRDKKIIIDSQGRPVLSSEGC